MIRLDKKLVDEVIRLSIEYYKTSDTDYTDAHFEAIYAVKEKSTWEVTNLLNALVRYTQTSAQATNDDIYQALAVFGIIVEEIENE